MVETLRERAKRLLADVPGEYVFRCVNGHTLRNLKELEAELKTISDEDYKQHANAQKNDFTNWVRDIIKDESLAKSLAKAVGRTQAARLAGSRLNDLSKL